MWNRSQDMCMRWSDLPDPRVDSGRTELTISFQAWQHIVAKHIVPGNEPWDDVFPKEVLNALAKSAQSAHGPSSMPEGVSEAFGWQVRETLSRPLVLLYESHTLGSPMGQPFRMWCLVLPAGATAYVRDQGKQGNSLRTCYFPTTMVVERNSQQRWRRVVRQLVIRYGIWDRDLGAVRLPADQTIRFSPCKGPVRELRSAINFVTPASWGFCPNVSGCPWGGPPQSWSVVVSSQASSDTNVGYRHPLKKPLEGVSVQVRQRESQ